MRKSIHCVTCYICDGSGIMSYSQPAENCNVCAGSGSLYKSNYVMLLNEHIEVLKEVIAAPKMLIAHSLNCQKCIKEECTRAKKLKAYAKQRRKQAEEFTT